MKQLSSLNWLIPLIVILTLVAAGVGLFWMDGGAARSFTTVHGETVQIYGQGLYSHNTVFSASTTRGTDMITLFVGLPVLIVSFVFYRRGSLRGGLMLTGILAYFLYYGASLGLDKAYNSLFLVWQKRQPHCCLRIRHCLRHCQNTHPKIMTSIQEIHNLLQLFQDVYTRRDLTQLDAFMELFTLDVEARCFKAI